MDLWMIRAGEEGFLIEEFKTKKIVAIGWNYLGDLKKYKNKEEIKNEFRKHRPQYNKYKIALAAGQISIFVNDIKNNDHVITYDPDNREYHIGKIISEYRPEPNLCEYQNIREVKWEGVINRDKLSASTKYKLGAIQTVFKVHEDAAKEIFDLLKGKEEKKEDIEEQKSEIETIKEDYIAIAHEFIKDKVITLSWEDMQELVAGVLRGMGYKTMVSPKGPDRGKDITASPDGLGLTQPRIFIEVKHRSGQIGAGEIRKFIGGLRSGSNGIYVSTGGFAKDAKYEAERSNIPLTLIDTDLLVDLIIEYYDNFDPDTRTLLPLTKMYWPS